MEWAKPAPDSGIGWSSAPGWTRSRHLNIETEDCASSRAHGMDRTRPDQSRPEQIRPDQSRPAQSSPVQSSPVQIRPDRTRCTPVDCIPASGVLYLRQGPHCAPVRLADSTSDEAQTSIDQPQDGPNSPTRDGGGGNEHSLIVWPSSPDVSPPARIGVAGAASTRATPEPTGRPVSPSQHRAEADGRLPGKKDLESRRTRTHVRAPAVGGCA
ncbi:unnamed protein product [Diplocarpon coronariae]